MSCSPLLHLENRLLKNIGKQASTKSCPSASANAKAASLPIVASAYPHLEYSIVVLVRKSEAQDRKGITYSCDESDSPLSVSLEAMLLLSRGQPRHRGEDAKQQAQKQVISNV